LQLGIIGVDRFIKRMGFYYFGVGMAGVCFLIPEVVLRVRDMIYTLPLAVCEAGLQCADDIL
jgi:hypothetical protein